MGQQERSAGRQEDGAELQEGCAKLVCQIEYTHASEVLTWQRGTTREGRRGSRKAQQAGRRAGLSCRRAGAVLALSVK